MRRHIADSYNKATKYYEKVLLSIFFTDGHTYHLTQDGRSVAD